MERCLAVRHRPRTAVRQGEPRNAGAVGKVHTANGAIAIRISAFPAHRQVRQVVGGKPELSPGLEGGAFGAFDACRERIGRTAARVNPTGHCRGVSVQSQRRRDAEIIAEEVAIEVVGVWSAGCPVMIGCALRTRPDIKGIADSKINCMAHADSAKVDCLLILRSPSFRNCSDLELGIGFVE